MKNKNQEIPTMTDIKKAGKRAGAEKAKKLQLTKETLKDITPTRNIRGGRGCGSNMDSCTGQRCTYRVSGCA